MTAPAGLVGGSLPLDRHGVDDGVGDRRARLIDDLHAHARGVRADRQRRPDAQRP